MIKLKDGELQIPVLDVLQALKIELASDNIELLNDIKDGPSNVMITCPFHNHGQEKRPSMGVKKQGGIAHCFTCGEVVDFTELISYCVNGTKSSQYGTTWLLNRYKDYVFQTIKENLKFNEFRGKERDKLIVAKCRGEHSDINIKTGKKESKHFVSETELDSYRWTHQYWAKRGITDESIIELFDLGYDKKTDCITFPVRDKNGNCEFVARRSVRTKFFQYPPGVSKPLYGLYEYYNGSEFDSSYRYSNTTSNKFILVCESMIDCVLLWQSGYYALALNGLGNDRQFKQLIELPVKHIILATDNDSAGKKARERIKKYVHNKIFSEIVFPENIKDIGECSREQVDNILQWEKYSWERKYST